MGSQVVAQCLCGLDTTVLIGGGMLNFETICFWPCFCERCCNVVEGNLLSKQVQCPNCNNPKVIPYDDPTLLAFPGDRKVADWNLRGEFGRVLKLTNGYYKCPKCGEMTLRFNRGYLHWD